MIRIAPRLYACPCCGQAETEQPSSGSVMGPQCTCRWTMWIGCFECWKCDAHCTCPDGPLRTPATPEQQLEWALRRYEPPAGEYS